MTKAYPAPVNNYPPLECMYIINLVTPTPRGDEVSGRWLKWQPRINNIIKTAMQRGGKACGSLSTTSGSASQWA